MPIVSSSSAIAVLIANSGYAHHPLITPQNDVGLVGDALERCGFAVEQHYDLTGDAFRGVLTDLSRTIATQAHLQTVFFYFAGHGVQVNGESYLLPIGMQLRHAHDIELQGISLNRYLLPALRHNPDTPKIVVIDACRVNPLGAGWEIGYSHYAPLAEHDIDNVLVAFAASGGKPARDNVGNFSPYAQALAEQLADPTLDVSVLFTRTRSRVRALTNGMQVPREENVLRDTFRLCQLGSPPESADSEPPQPVKGRSSITEEIARKGHLIHKLKAKDANGRQAYYFVLIEPSREQAFMNRIGGSGIFDLENYGKVIASCYGEEPNDEIKFFLKDRYGFIV